MVVFGFQILLKPTGFFPRTAAVLLFGVASLGKVVESGDFVWINLWLIDQWGAGIANIAGLSEHFESKIQDEHDEARLTILVFRWKSETAALCWAAYAIRAAHGNPSSPLQGLPAEIDELQKVTLRLFEEKVFQPRTTRGHDSAYSVWSDLPKHSIQHWQNIPGPSKSSSVGYIISISLYYSKTLKEYIT